MSWPIAALGDLCEINIGRTPSRACPEYWVDGTNPWVSIADMSRSERLKETKERITDQGVDESGIRPVAPGTVLLSFKLSIGKLAVAEVPLFTNEAIAALPIKRADKLAPSYLFRALQNMDFDGAGNRAVMGRTLNKQALAELMIPLPPLEEQRRMATILEKADALRRKRRGALQLLDSMTESIFSEMFGSIDVLRGRSDIAKLGDLISDQRIGLVRAASELALDPPGVPYLRMDAIGADGNLDLTGLKFTNASAAEVATFSLREGDLLFNTRNSRELVGKTAIFYGEKQVIYNNNILRMRFSASVTPEYMLSYFRTKAGMRELDARKAGTTSVYAIYQKSLVDLPVVVPPIARQHEFSGRVLALAAQALNFRKQSDRFEALFSSLQHRAFTGQL